MKKEIANIWIKALKSGKYKQGRGTLRTDDDKFCCLGVLCDLYDKDRKAKKKKSIKVSKPKYNGNKDKVCYKYGNTYDYLPSEVRKWAGMKSNNGSFCHDDSTYLDLAIINDDESHLGYKNFKQIAKIIEQNVDIL
jgi:hypothetical protein